MLGLRSSSSQTASARASPKADYAADLQHASCFPAIDSNHGALNASQVLELGLSRSRLMRNLGGASCCIWVFGLFGAIWSGFSGRTFEVSNFGDAQPRSSHSGLFKHSEIALGIPCPS